MSGVFSIASHSTLQYLPDVVMHEQIGWAHFSAFVVAIFFSPDFESIADDPRLHLKSKGNDISVQ